MIITDISQIPYRDYWKGIDGRNYRPDGNRLIFEFPYKIELKVELKKKQWQMGVTYTGRTN